MSLVQVKAMESCNGSDEWDLDPRDERKRFHPNCYPAWNRRTSRISAAHLWRVRWSALFGDLFPDRSCLVTFADARAMFFFS